MSIKSKIRSWIQKYRPGRDNRIAGSFTKIFFLAIDLSFSLAAFAFAVFVDRTLNSTSWTLVMLSSVPLILLILRAISFLVFKTYLIIIRFVGEQDFLNLLFAATSSTVAFYAILKFFPLALPGDSAATVVVIDYLFLLYLSGGFRIFLRVLYKYLRKKTGYQTPNTIIYGAGQLGAQTLSIIQNSTTNQFRVVAFVDDNPKVNRKQLNGVPIYLTDRHLENLIDKQNIKKSIVAIRDLPDDRRIKFINTCLENQVEVLKVPTTEKWNNNQLSQKQLKKVKLADLLNRPAIQLDKQKISAEVNGQCILVTGCAGSIGSEIVRQLLKFEPKKVVGIDQAETPLVELKRELRDERFVSIVGDVRSKEKIREVFEEFLPKYVFHAAAYKHVPLMESHPNQAVETNLLGTIHVAKAASKFKAKKFVLVSTDKVINPTNVMGASKRAAEIYIRKTISNPGVKTQFIITRFGNVLGSNGSVVPLFQKQIENQKPLTVTHKEVTRYFMIIPEACQLVLEAGVMGNGGEIFVFDMGKPVKIYDLARRLIQLSGLIPNKDIPIHITGLRPGEKLYEELLSDREKVKPTHHPKIMISGLESDCPDIHTECLKELIRLCKSRNSDKDIIKCLQHLIPEYSPKKNNPDKPPYLGNEKLTTLKKNNIPVLKKNEENTAPPNQETQLGKLKGRRGLKHLFLRTVGRVIPTDVFAARHSLSVKGICTIDNRVLLLKTETGQWDLPGGKLKPGEQWEKCIKREIKEELNLEVQGCNLLKLQSDRLRKAAKVTVALAHCQVVQETHMISLSQEHFGVQLASAAQLKSISLLLPYEETILDVLQQNTNQIVKTPES